MDKPGPYYISYPFSAKPRMHGVCQEMIFIPSGLIDCLIRNMSILKYLARARIQAETNHRCQSRISCTGKHPRFPIVLKMTAVCWKLLTVVGPLGPWVQFQSDIFINCLSHQNDLSIITEVLRFLRLVTFLGPKKMLDMTHMIYDFYMNQ